MQILWHGDSLEAIVGCHSETLLNGRLNSVTVSGLSAGNIFGCGKHHGQWAFCYGASARIKESPCCSRRGSAGPHL